MRRSTQFVGELSRNGAPNTVPIRSSEPADGEAAAQAAPNAHRSENRPSLRNEPVSRATRGDTNMPMWLTCSTM